MGRGRQKAKHTKLARELKYNEIETDLNTLQEELSSGPSQDSSTPAPINKKSSDEYTELAKKYGVEDAD